MALYESLKGMAYPCLAVAGCDHPKAVSKGYEDGWAMLLALHDSNEMPAFIALLVKSDMSEKQRQILLDNLARQYTDHDGWMSYVDACCAGD